MIGYQDVKNLKYHAREFAMMMDTDDIEAVIAEFVAVKNIRDSYQNRASK